MGDGVSQTSGSFLTGLRAWMYSIRVYQARRRGRFNGRKARVKGRFEARKGSFYAEPEVMIPCIPGVTQLQEAGRNAHIVGYQGKQDNREVIVELFREESGEQDWFFRSAALQSRLAQAAIPTYLEVGWVEGRPYRLREYVQGRAAQQLLSDGPLAEERLVALARSLAAALKALHQRGFVHGALTIDHVRVDRSGVFRLLDAGRCEPIGSPFHAKGDEYTAPELLYGQPLRPAADLASLRVVESCPAELNLEPGLTVVRTLGDEPLPGHARQLVLEPLEPVGRLGSRIARSSS